MVGADTEQLSALGAAMDRQADRLDQVRSELGAGLAFSTWDGVDAEDFRYQWDNQLSGLLLGISDTLRSQAGVLRQNAEQQRVASESTVGSLHGGGFQVDGGSGQPGLSSGLLSPGHLSILLGGLFIASDVAEMLGKHGIGKELTALRVVGPVVTKGLAGVSLLWDAATFVNEVATNPGSDDAWNSGANLAFSVAATGAGLMCPPVGIAIAVAGLGYNIATEINPSLTRDIVDDIGNAGRDVMNAVDTGMDLLGDGVEAVGGIVSNGIKGLLGL
jgi:hypothetical protein